MNEAEIKSLEVLCEKANDVIQVKLPETFIEIYSGLHADGENVYRVYLEADEEIIRFKRGTYLEVVEFIIEELKDLNLEAI